MLEYKLRRLLAYQCFSRFGGNGARRVTLCLTKKTTNRLVVSNERDDQPATADLTIMMSTSSFNSGKSQSNRLDSNAKEKGLAITLDNLAVQRMQMLFGK